jgi:hypothetical protein
MEQDRCLEEEGDTTGRMHDAIKVKGRNSKAASLSKLPASVQAWWLMEDLVLIW